MNTLPNGRIFICRVCRSSAGFSNHYASECVVNVRHPDSRETAEGEKGEPFVGFSCNHCSVVFRDPVLFSVTEVYRA